MTFSVPPRDARVKAPARDCVRSQGPEELMIPSRSKRVVHPRIRTGAYAMSDPGSRTITLCFPPPLQMAEDELAHRRRTGRWTARRSETILLHEIAALRPRSEARRKVGPVSRPRSRREARRRVRSSRGSPDGSDPPPAAEQLHALREAS